MKLPVTMAAKLKKNVVLGLKLFQVSLYQRGFRRLTIGFRGNSSSTQVNSAYIEVGGGRAARNDSRSTFGQTIPLAAFLKKSI